MSITTAAVLASASKTGRTVSLVLDAYAGATSTFVYDSSAAVTNGYVARIDPDGTYTPLNGGVGTPLGPSPAFSGSVSISGTLGITPSSNSQTALTISAPAAGSLDALDLYVGVTKKVWVDNTGQLSALAASVSALTITTSLTLPAPLSLSQGGTGTSSPALANGSNISITGSFPNHTVGVVASPSFTSLTMNGAVTWPAAGTATSGANYGSISGPTLNVSLWNGSAAVAHSWQMLGDSALGNLRFYYDGNLHAALPAAGGLLVKGTDWSTTVVTLGADGTGTFTGALSATALTLSATPLAVTSGGTGTASPAFVNGTGISITGSFPNHAVGLSHGDYADVVNAQTIAGIKTFSSAPVMSGASISASTIADGSLATQYVLTVGASGNLSSSGGRNPSITITATPTFGATTVAALVATTGSFSGAVTSRGLTIQDPTTSTKQAAFAMSSISASTTRTFTFPDVNGTLVTTGDTGSITNAMLAGSIAVAKLVALSSSRAVVTDSSGFLAVGAGLPVTVADTGSVTNTMLAGSIAATKLVAMTGSRVVITDGSGFLSVGAGLPVTLADTGSVTNTMLAGSIAQSKLSPFAGVSVGGALTGATTGAFSGSVTGGSFATTGMTIQPLVSSLAIISPAAGATSGFHINDSSGANVNFALSDAGAGSFRANVSGTYFVANGSAGTAQFAFTTSGVTGSTQTSLLSNSASTSGVIAGALAVYANGATTPQLLAIDGTGNVGIVGSFKTGTSVYGPTSATVNGGLTLAGPLAGVSTGGFSSTVTAGSFATGSSTYGPTSAFINGTSFQVGATGTTSTDVGLYIGNNQGGSNQAFVVSHDVSSVAGITATCLAFGQAGLINAMNLDLAGNLGIAGTYYAVSHSSHKVGIRPITFDPIDVIKRTTVRHFNYRHDPVEHEERLGLIADESPVEMMGPTQDRHDFMRTIAVLVAANQALIAKHEALEARVKDLELRCAS